MAVRMGKDNAQLLGLMPRGFLSQANGFWGQVGHGCSGNMLQSRRAQEMERKWKLKLCRALEEALPQTIGQEIGWLHSASSAKDGKGIGESLSRHMPLALARFGLLRRHLIYHGGLTTIGAYSSVDMAGDGFHLFPP